MYRNAPFKTRKHLGRTFVPYRIFKILDNISNRNIKTISIFIHTHYRVLFFKYKVTSKRDYTLKLERQKFSQVCRAAKSLLPLSHRSTWVQGIPTPQASPPSTTPSFLLFSLQAFQKSQLRPSQHAWLTTF